jgi:hypothetical protein
MLHERRFICAQREREERVMGTRLGQLPSAAEAQRLSVVARQQAFQVNTERPETPLQQVSDRLAEQRRIQPDVRGPQLGFGNETVSIPSLAVQTIGRNFESARELVPTFQELSQEARARAAEAQAQIEAAPPADEQPAPLANPENVAGAGLGRARQFLEAVSESNRAVEARRQGEPEPVVPAEPPAQPTPSPAEAAAPETNNSGQLLNIIA